MDADPPSSTPPAQDTPLTGGPQPAGGSMIHYILFGPEGLRAGSGITLFLAIYYAMARCLQPVRQFVLHAQPIHGDLLSARQVFCLEVAGIVAVVTATWLMSRLERRRVTAYGLARGNRVRYFFGGLMWGLALLSLLVFLLRACGLLVFDARLLTGAAAVRYGLMWLAGFLLVSVREELFSRGYLQYTLTRGLRSIFAWIFGPLHANALGFWIAAATLSYLFGFGHSSNPDESPLGLLAAGLAGFLFCLSLWRTGSLWWAIGFHASWDWAQSFLYGVPDSGLMARGHLFATHAMGRPWLSGGVTGPEGSILFLPVALAGAGVVLLSLPRTHNGYISVACEEPPEGQASVLP